MVDLRNCDPVAIRDRRAMEELIQKITVIAKMKPLGAMVTAELPETPQFIKQGNDGVTYVQLIQTSSITIHAVHSSRELHFDLISCKEFEEAPVVLLLLGALKTKQFVKNSLSR